MTPGTNAAGSKTGGGTSGAGGGGGQWLGDKLLARPGLALAAASAAALLGFLLGGI